MLAGAVDDNAEMENLESLAENKFEYSQGHYGGVHRSIARQIPFSKQT